MDARVHDVLADDDLGVGEHRFGRGGVARLPVEAVVVGLALEIVADHRRVGVEGVTNVDHRIERLVLDVDQLQCVARRVAVLGDDEGDLLVLEADLVGGEDRLHVVGQCRHPGEILRGEVLAGDHGFDLRVCFRGGLVDADDAGVGHRRPEDRHVQHAGQFDVVAVLAEAAHEARVLLAEHAAEAGRLVVVEIVVRGRDGVGRCVARLFGDAHDGLPAESSAPARSFAAAHWIERTMVA